MTTVRLAVNGTLMRGLELNTNLLNVGATFVCEAQTDPYYRLWSIHDRHPAMMRVATGGTSVALEIWELPAAAIAVILEQEPAGLCIGRITLDDGSSTLGVLGEAYLCESGTEITKFGGWRNYMTSQQTHIEAGSNQ
ncbi:MAG TPA: hypothetical protein P5121_14145 [Caldilineaceae bacterium]|nr:hypothetical protein [Caldilineaceae bacterium]